MAPERETRRGDLLRASGPDARVTHSELFFDLVYVFAVTQLSHRLHDHLDASGAAETLLLLMVVWWAWVYTAWFTNWFNPDRLAVRLVLVGVMLGSLVMSASLPEAFDDRGLAFAAAYVAIQVGRTGFTVVVLRRGDALRPNLERVLAWAVFSGVLWLAGGAAEGDARVLLWIAAVVLDYTAPLHGFTTPGLGRSHTSDWTIAGSHLAERCQLFVLIALGESILTTGASFAELAGDAATAAAFAVAFAGSVALWWIYFDRGAEAGHEAISTTDDPGRLARSAYTLLHLPMVGGVIAAAVADERTIAHPDAGVGAATAAVILGGPALYLVGNALFNQALTGRLALSRLAAVGGLALLVPLATVSSALVLSSAAAVVIIAVAVWDGLAAMSATAPSRPAGLRSRSDRA